MSHILHLQALDSSTSLGAGERSIWSTVSVGEVCLSSTVSLSLCTP